MRSGHDSVWPHAQKRRLSWRMTASNPLQHRLIAIAFSPGDWARACGLDRDGGDRQPTEELIAAVISGHTGIAILCLTFRILRCGVRMSPSAQTPRRRSNRSRLPPTSMRQKELANGADRLESSCCRTAVLTSTVEADQPSASSCQRRLKIDPFTTASTRGQFSDDADTSD
jgi:hypothetical protein